MDKPAKTLKCSITGNRFRKVIQIACQVRDIFDDAEDIQRCFVRRKARLKDCLMALWERLSIFLIKVPDITHWLFAIHQYASLQSHHPVVLLKAWLLTG